MTLALCRIFPFFRASSVLFTLFFRQIRSAPSAPRGGALQPRDHDRRSSAGRDEHPDGGAVCSGPGRRRLRGRGAGGKTLVLIATEETEKGIGRIRLSPITDASGVVTQRNQPLREWLV